MKRLFILIALIFAACATIAEGQTGRRRNTGIRKIAGQIADAYEGRDLGSLDRLGLISGTVKIVIEHSIPPEDSEQFVIRRFRSFYKAEHWLANRHPQPGLPFRAVQDFQGCRRGNCTFYRDGGISHNHLYLKAISYGYRAGRLYIKELYLYDGD